VVEPVSAALAGGAMGMYVAKKVTDGLAKLLGPSADEVAQALQRFTETKLRNVGRVVEAAERKTSSCAEGGGAVPLRVALRVLDEGAYADNDLVVEYLGGVLASSRTPGGRDDRGNTFIALVSRLSTYQLRTHYIFYSEFQRLLHGQQIELRDADEVDASGQIFVPHTVWHEAMDYGRGEDPLIIGSSTMWWLRREQLLDWGGDGDPAYLESISRYQNYSFPESGTIALPTIPGVELYLWALGKGHLHSRDFLTISVADSAIPGIDIGSQTYRLEDLIRH
jgi:hypothetical protein